jgi:hypothetical protein
MDHKYITVSAISPNTIYVESIVGKGITDLVEQYLFESIYYVTFPINSNYPLKLC